MRCGGCHLWLEASTWLSLSFSFLRLGRLLLELELSASLSTSDKASDLKDETHSTSEGPAAIAIQACHAAAQFVGNATLLVTSARLLSSD